MERTIISVREQDIETGLSSLLEAKKLYLPAEGFDYLKRAAIMLYNRLSIESTFNSNVTICADDQNVSSQYGMILVELMESWYADCGLLVNESELYDRRNWKADYKKCKIIMVNDYASEFPDRLFSVYSEIEAEGWSQAVILCTKTSSLDAIKDYSVQDYRLFHYLCGYKVIVPEVQESDISEMTFRRLVGDGYELTDAFKSKLDFYNRAVYPEAQLTKMNYVEDLIHRIYQVHYQKIVKDNILDESDVPYSAKADMLIKEEQSDVQNKSTDKDNDGGLLSSNDISSNDIGTASPDLQIAYDVDNIIVDPNPDYEICKPHKHINVLLLALSTFSYDKAERIYKVSETTFSYNGSNYTGRYQLDPVPKLLSKELNHKGERLDYVICFCTTKRDSEGNILVPEVLKAYSVFVPVKGSEEKGMVSISALEYFRKQIGQYIPNDGIERVIPVTLDEGNPASGIEEAIRIIRDLDKKSDGVSIGDVHLYLDSHGGFRDVQLTLQAVISLLGKEKITVEDCFSVKYGRGHNTVTRDMSTEMFDFASGINEFINYGRLQSLEKYFDNRYLDNKNEINAFLNILRKISDSISICDTIEFEEGLNELTAYYNMNTAASNLDYLAIFTKTIRSDFGALLKQERTVIDEIAWCLKKSFYQQALTLIESRMPGEFVKNGLRYYCDHSNSDVAQTVFDDYYRISVAREKWKIEDPDHFFIKYYNIMRKGNRLIKEIIVENHNNDGRYNLENKTLYTEHADLVNTFLDDKNEKHSYQSLCILRNQINHGGRIEVDADELRLRIEQFITTYLHILQTSHIENHIIRFVFHNNSFNLVKSKEWELELISDSEQYTDKELTLMKMIQYTFKEEKYQDNRCDYATLINDVKKTCEGDVPTRMDFGSSPLQLLNDKSQGLYVREGNVLCWNPSV